ncbi:MAG: HI0074 family nucleotidyltransferase substrate-binding subunit [Alphaproteobacteria bacterium]|nr:HI0074 family nucleotidyltransferase substrate-binding subunit [Alphaproteobacteria bacterium]
MIDVGPLARALASLTEALEAYEQRDRDPFVRDAAIQRFEYTYELTHKMLRRALAEREPASAAVNELSFPDLVRLAHRRGLVRSEWAVWRRFREDRNATSHTYNPDTADRVFAGLMPFRDEAAYVLMKLTRRQADPDDAEQE